MHEARYIPPRESARFRAWFEGWCRGRMIGKKFCALRVERAGVGLLRSVAGIDGPLIVAANHVGWWDPLTMLTLHEALLSGRSMRAPMDAEQLERFGLFRRLGVFGIDPDDPASLEKMREEMAAYFARADRPTLWITPQGRFADVREPIVVRPGVSRLAASTPGARVVAVSVEYCFWTDPKPEILVAAREVVADRGSTTGWHRAIASAMADGAAELARLAVARDADAFEPVVSKEGRQGGFWYDLWLKVRGRGGGIAATRETPQKEGGGPASGGGARGEHTAVGGPGPASEVRA